jgi:hypothetical protein
MLYKHTAFSTIISDMSAHPIVFREGVALIKDQCLNELKFTMGTGQMEVGGKTYLYSYGEKGSWHDLLQRTGTTATCFWLGHTIRIAIYRDGEQVHTVRHHLRGDCETLNVTTPPEKPKSVKRVSWGDSSPNAVERRRVFQLPDSSPNAVKRRRVFQLPDSSESGSETDDAGSSGP